MFNDVQGDIEMSGLNKTAAAYVILRLTEVMARTGLGRSTLYDKWNAKSPRHDPTFPKPIPLGGRAVGVLESELNDWIAAQVERARRAA
ncbi:helix-turn-helix transcriptional regulator [Methylocaldum sp. MU1018]